MGRGVHEEGGAWGRGVCITFAAKWTVMHWKAPCLWLLCAHAHPEPVCHLSWLLIMGAFDEWPLQQ
jgi:hypothetical protein